MKIIQQFSILLCIITNISILFAGSNELEQEMQKFSKRIHEKTKEKLKKQYVEFYTSNHFLQSVTMGTVINIFEAFNPGSTKRGVVK